ncbi:MAG TPA: hypothetical protein VFP72_01920 [Kineosporiaceae bacterium]|nr:hypothetical protein [Kineosporiaceae bacterium]
MLVIGLVLALGLPAATVGVRHVQGEGDSPGPGHLAPDHSISALPATATVTPGSSGSASPVVTDQKAKKPGKRKPARRPAVKPPVKPSPAFPDATNTGVPRGTRLTRYTGDCVIWRANTVIDAKDVRCQLIVVAPGVRITRSRVDGGVDLEGKGSLVISDSEIIAPPDGTGVGDWNFTVLRSNLWGGKRQVNCYDNCVVRDSWIHGTRFTGATHSGGMRAGMHTTYVHNTVVCDSPDSPQDGGCSADITMYGDFSTVHDVRIEHNLFKATPGGFCAYGGSTPGKPYPDAHHVVFVDNVFEKAGRPCGIWGAIRDFDIHAPGNGWSGNVWSDGRPVPAPQTLS